MIPLDVDALLAQICWKAPCAGVTQVTEVTPATISRNHAGQEPLTAVTHADPRQGNTGNTSEAGAPDVEAVTRVTPRPPALGNRRIAPQGIGTASVREPVTPVTRVTQQNECAAQARKTHTVSWRCYCCQGTRHWRSIYGAVVCARCHPPADMTLVAAREGVA